ncbi:bifunctional heptose 7-phosphate kinase/heptose 1-phosphate adenyltransferase, partial [Candidatus Pseudothioglobus singularis]|nr:bifunctional heptose 7-phosphate kinase/heptose 1-phosphate adenyltransferase [Candidatus Pseudothioglobus singularis]
IISVIGECENSKILIKLLKSISIDTKFLITELGRIASKKSRVIVSKQQVARYDLESEADINSKSENEIITIFKSIIKNYDILLLSDYGKGVLTSSLTQYLIKTANKNDIKVLVDPKGFNYSKYKGSYLLTPNKQEASESTNININDKQSLNEAIIKLKNDLNLTVSLVTLSEDGIAIFDNELRIHPTISKEVFDVTGAGDTVLASLGFAIACGVDIDNAVKFSNLAAGVVVGKIGSATATIDEIIEFESSFKQSNTDIYIKTISEITVLSHQFNMNNLKVVFTNGCFDLLHLGHVKYLEEAKNYGDILIVGINSDRSTSALKGKNRPINSQLDRAHIIASLKTVDYVVIFDEDTPYELIKAIKPDTLVKGGDYKDLEIVGKDIAKNLEIVKFIDGKSTTNTINLIQQGNK